MNGVIITVPITGQRQRAKIYEDDYNELLNLGIKPNWISANGQVVVRHLGRLYLNR